MRKIYLALIKIFESKKNWKRPPHSDVVIFDNVRAYVFHEYLKGKNFHVLDTRLESINLFVVLILICKLKFSFKPYEYFVEYLKITKCKLIITFVDNNNFYYKIKNKLPNLKTISIQNGLRPEYFFCELSKNKELKSDYILTWGDEIAKKYKENINTQTITIGSFYNNFIKKYKKKRNSVAFISSGYGMNKVQMRIFSGTNKNKFFMEANKYFSAEKILVPKIYEYCKKNNLEFEVIGRCEKNAKGSYWSRPDKEHKFYKDILSDGNFKYHEKNDAYSCYQIADESKLSISIYSAFGLEALARKLRIVFFNIRDFSTDHKSLNLFWPAKISDRGEFWTNSMNETEVKRVLNYALFAKEEDWNNSIKKVIPSLINFDADNSIFVKLLNKLL